MSGADESAKSFSLSKEKATHAGASHLAIGTLLNQQRTAHLQANLPYRREGLDNVTLTPS